jgi:hypothetical protein
MRLLQMEPIQEALARIDHDVVITMATPDVREDIQVSECDLISDDNGESEGGEVESVPNETDYVGNLYDKFEVVLAVQEHWMEADGDLVLNQSNPDAEVASSWGKTAATPSNQRNECRPLSSPPSPLPNPLPPVPTSLIPPSEDSQNWHLKEGTQTPMHNTIQPFMVSGEQCRPLAAPPEPSCASGHFHIMGEVITEFNSPTQWMQGTMIQAFGEMCCRPTYSHPECACCVDILPSDLPAMLEQLKQGTEGDRLELEMQIGRCLQPDHCGMWLIPVCHKLHWWLIKIDWIGQSASILDSFSTCGSDAKEVLIFARKIVAKIHEVLKRPYVPWSSFLLDQVSPSALSISFAK